MSIIRQIGTPALPPKPRGIPPGRQKGTACPKRPRPPIIKKRPLLEKISKKARITASSP